MNKRAQEMRDIILDKLNEWDGSYGILFASLKMVGNERKVRCITNIKDVDERIDAMLSVFTAMSPEDMANAIYNMSQIAYEKYGSEAMNEAIGEYQEEQEDE